MLLFFFFATTTTTVIIMIIIRTAKTKIENKNNVNALSLAASSGADVNGEGDGVIIQH